MSESAKLALAAMLNTTLGRYLLPVTAVLPTLNQMIASGHRALVSFDDDGVNAAYRTLWPGCAIILLPPPCSPSRRSLSSSRSALPCQVLHRELVRKLGQSDGDGAVQ